MNVVEIAERQYEFTTVYPSEGHGPILECWDISPGGGELFELRQGTNDDLSLFASRGQIPLAVILAAVKFIQT